MPPAAQSETVKLVQKDDKPIIEPTAGGSTLTEEQADAKRKRRQKKKRNRRKKKKQDDLGEGNLSSDEDGDTSQSRSTAVEIPEPYDEEFEQELILFKQRLEIPLNIDLWLTLPSKVQLDFAQEHLCPSMKPNLTAEWLQKIRDLLDLLEPST